MLIVPVVLELYDKLTVDLASDRSVASFYRACSNTPPFEVTSSAFVLICAAFPPPPLLPPSPTTPPYSLDVHSSMSASESTSVFPLADPGGGASEIRRLQELLHQALRREAEALKKLKHLNEAIISCERDRPTCGSVSSASDGRYPSPQLLRILYGHKAHDSLYYCTFSLCLCTGPECRVDSPLDDWDREEGQVYR